MRSPFSLPRFSPLSTEFHTGPVAGAEGFWHGTLIYGRSMGILLALLCGFTFALIITSRRMHLYTPTRIASFLHEQRLSVQACFTSGLLLTGTLYLVHAAGYSPQHCSGYGGFGDHCAEFAPPGLPILLYRRFDRGVGTRNVLIVGTGPEAHALRHHLESIRHLGYTFKGFIDFPGSNSRFTASSGDVVGRSILSSNTPASSLSTRSSLPLPASAGSYRTCSIRPAFMASICALFPTCTTVWPGTVPSSTSASSRRFRCIAATCPRWDCCSSESSISFSLLRHCFCFRRCTAGDRHRRQAGFARPDLLLL